MSAIKLNSSGGGSITISPASTASTLTLTAPAQTGTIGLDGPAFSAYLPSNQTGITGSTFVKVQCSVEEFDTASCYDTSNYRFTPNVAGYYQISGALYAGGSVSTTGAACVIYKNGSQAKYGAIPRSPSGVANFVCPVSAIIYMNGSSDYLEFYGYAEVSGTATFISGSSLTYFQAALIRGA